MKAEKEKKIKIRRFWKIKPATKIKQSEKLYSRKKEKEEIEEEVEEGE